MVYQKQFVNKLKAYTFANMIVKSALIFLRIVDFFWDAYERTLRWVTSVREKKAMATSISDSTEPSYLIR